MTENDLKNLKEIFEKAKKGDKESFSEIYEAYFKPLYRYVYLRVGNKVESDDLVQDVFIKALGSVADSDSNYSSRIIHFYIVARKSVLDWKRKRRHVALSDDNLESYSGARIGQSERSSNKEEFDNLHKAIKELPEEYQDAVILKFIGGLSNDDVGDVLGVSGRSVLRLEAQGLISIRDILKQQYEPQL